MSDDESRSYSEILGEVELIIFIQLNNVNVIVARDIGIVERAVGNEVAIKFFGLTARIDFGKVGVAENFVSRAVDSESIAVSQVAQGRPFAVLRSGSEFSRRDGKFFVVGGRDSLSVLSDCDGSVLERGSFIGRGNFQVVARVSFFVDCVNAVARLKSRGKIGGESRVAVSSLNRGNDIAVNGI